MTLDTATERPVTGRPKDPLRRVALLGGVIYLVTFAASFPQLALFADVVADPAGYITSPGSDTAVLVGCWLELVTAAACVGTAVALWALPVAVWELALGVWLTDKGFRAPPSGAE